MLAGASCGACLEGDGAGSAWFLIFCPEYRHTGQAIRSKWRSIATCSLGNLFNDVERCLGPTLPSRDDDTLLLLTDVSRNGAAGTVSSGSHARPREDSTDRKECTHPFSPTSGPISDKTLRADVAEQLKLNSLGTVSGDNER